MGRLAGKVAAITGGASGMGAATVRRFVAEDARVVIADLQVDKGEAMAAECGGAAAFIATDVGSETDVAAMVACAVDRFGRLDCLFNNAASAASPAPSTRPTWANPMPARSQDS